MQLRLKAATPAFSVGNLIVINPTALSVDYPDDKSMLEHFNQKAAENDDWYYWSTYEGRAWIVITAPAKDATCGGARGGGNSITNWVKRFMSGKNAQLKFRI